MLVIFNIANIVQVNVEEFKRLVTVLAARSKREWMWIGDILDADGNLVPRNEQEDGGEEEPQEEVEQYQRYISQHYESQLLDEDESQNEF